MGTAMAKNLAAAGHRVIACVRRPQQMGTLLALGLKPTTDLADLFDCEIVISMLPDDAAVREVALGREDIKGLTAGLARGAIHLSMSTISTAAASQVASAHARCGQGYVAAPVFGNPDAAKVRQLFVIAAGAPTDVERRANLDGRADSMRRIYTQGRANDDNMDQVSSAMPRH